jgi:GNAT superfamily N-acetyltransferase
VTLNGPANAETEKRKNGTSFQKDFIRDKSGNPIILAENGDVTLPCTPYTPYTLCPAHESDLALTYEITRDAMRDYVIQTWGLWDEEEQRHKHQQNYTPTTHRIVLCGAKAAGLLAVEIEHSHLWLVKLYLRKPVRGRGLGTSLLRLVIEEADQLGKPVRLRVLKVNEGAQRLYRRHGFAVVGETPERLFMVRSTCGV